MPLNLRASQKLRNFNVPLSYIINDSSGKFIDARNVNAVQDRLDTRFGTSRYNDNSLGGKVLSLSSFVKSDGSRYTIAKVGTELKLVPEANGAITTIKTGLSPNTVHRAITGNDRHIIAIEEDGLFSYNGTIFTRLGQPAPQTGSAAIATGGALTIDTKYRVAISFYASSIGFESNAYELNEVTTSTGNLKIDVSGIPASAENGFIDKVYIYLKNVTTDGEYAYSGEVLLGTTTYSVLGNTTSTQTTKTQNDAPNANTPIAYQGGGKYLVNFNSKLAYTGNSIYPNEVYFSEPDTFDAFNSLDTGLVLPMPGRGKITGLAVGLFSDTVLDPFLAIFKGKSTWIYSEIGGQPKRVCISEEIGCVSHDSIIVKNGVIYFLSEEGWRAIANGRLVVDSQGDAVTLGNGDIDDIFKSPGFTYEVNRAGLEKSFSVYYPALDQYLTWVSEGTSDTYSKTYNYQFEASGFIPYEFAVPATCVTLAENGSGRDVVLFGTLDGYIIKHSVVEKRSDVNAAGSEVAINAFAVLPWLPKDGDDDATYSYRELILRAISSSNPLTVKTYLDFNLSKMESGTYDFSDPNGGFILDQDLLDEGLLGDERSTVTARADINRVGESIAIGFYQSTIGANIGLISMQVDSNKNGNRNIATDSEENDGGFDSETGTYFPSASESAMAAALSAQQAAASAAEAASGGGLPLGGDPGDFIERDIDSLPVWKVGSYDGISALTGGQFTSTGLKDTLDKIIRITYTPAQISLSASPGQGVREKGDTVSSVNLTANTVKKSNPISEVRFKRAGVLVESRPGANPAGGSEAYTNNTAFADTMTFTAEVDDTLSGGSGPTTTTSNTVTYPFVYPYYMGAGVPGKSASQVAALTKVIMTSNSNYNRNFTHANGDVFYFAYPASYGALTSIKDPNNFETLGDWALSTSNITGLDGNAVSYRIYEFNNPVVAGSTAYTFQR